MDILFLNEIRKMAAITKFERLKQIRENAPFAVRHFFEGENTGSPG
jgi:hypothetical protein